MLYTNPRSHSIYKKIRAFGDAEQVEHDIDREISDDSRFVIARSNAYNCITKNYILSRGDGKFDLNRTENLVWAYKETVRNRYGVSYYVRLWFKDGKTMCRLGAKTESDADSVMAKIFSQLPVVCGYSTELKKAYNKNLSEFMNVLQQRKDQFYAENGNVNS